ncbi:Y-family DNA polymerase [Roseomonas sp. USHLN139]|uniref:Y-family DNA polymerase n=1 Tax=Roseomonas sp. USHLN139 TaxID=3081298 RepID=UPI003B0221D9
MTSSQDGPGLPFEGGRRFLALHLPELPTDRLRRARPEWPRDRPLAAWERQGSRRLLTAVDAAAARIGLLAGQALADAQAICPGLLLHPADPAADAAALEALALWARRWTPLAAADPPDGLLLDITGCAPLFGGEHALLAEACARLRSAGIAARGAVAGQPGSAGALARARRDNPVIRSGQEARMVAPLPIGPALRLEAGLQAALSRLGLRRLDDLLNQPRAPLQRRFGLPLLQALDAATGRRSLPLTPAVPPPDLRVTLSLLEPVLTRSGIEAVLERLLAALCARLHEAGLGARRLGLTAWRGDGTLQALAIGTGLATREPAHLRRLFAEPLGSLRPELGFERMALEAWAPDPLSMGRQAGLGLGVRLGEVDDAAAAEALAQLLDRLGQRLRLRRPGPQPSHWPERMQRALPVQAATPPRPPGWGAAPAPVLLRREPFPLDLPAGLPPELPLQLPWRGGLQAVAAWQGPMRREPEWWRAPPGTAARDYHRVELASGERLWLCRAGGRWLLHGHLP